MTYSNLPVPIAAFLSAAQTRNVDALHGIFANDAVLNDRGAEHRGGDIKGWGDRYLLSTDIRQFCGVTICGLYGGSATF
jgi:hypothetical protein